MPKEHIVRKSSPIKKPEMHTQTRFRKTRKRDDVKPYETKSDVIKIELQNNLKSLQEAFSTTKIDLEEGKKPIKVPSKFQQ